MSQRAPATANERLLVNVVAAADALSLSPRHVHRLISDGRLPSVRLGRRRLIPWRALEEFAQQSERDTGPRPGTCAASERRQQ